MTLRGHVNKDLYKLYVHYFKKDKYGVHSEYVSIPESLYNEYANKDVLFTLNNDIVLIKGLDPESENN